MTPEELKKKIDRLWEYYWAMHNGITVRLLHYISSILSGLWHWFNNKKTTIGAIFFFTKEWIIVPYYDKVLHSTIPDTLNFYLAVIAAIFTVLGVTHKSIRYISDKRNGGAHGIKAVTKSNLD